MTSATPGSDDSSLFDYVVMGLLCALSFCVYCHTLCTSVYPGASAVATGHAMGLLPGAQVSHPVWLVFARAVAALPVMDLPFRLNLFSAACGSLAVGLVFRVARRLIFEMICAAATLGEAPAREGGSGLGSERAGDGGARVSGGLGGGCNESVAATLGGMVCALAFAFSAPFWLASTALHAQTFDTLLLLVAVYGVTVYAFTARMGYGVAAVFLSGVLGVEAPVFAMLAPVLVLFVAAACVRLGQHNGIYPLRLLVAGLAGAVGGLALYGVTSEMGGAGLAATLGCFARTYKAGLVDMLVGEHRLFTVALPLIAFLLACLCLLAETFREDQRAARKLHVVCVLNTAYTMAGLLALPNTVWAVSREGTQLPVLTSLAVACTAGLLFVYWFRLATAPSRNAESPAGTAPLLARFASFGVCGLLVVVMLRSVAVNLPDADGRRAGFADAVAQEIIELAPDARCLITDGTLELHLLIRARLAGRGLEVLPVNPAGGGLARGVAVAYGPHRVAGAGGGAGSDLEGLAAKWLREHPADHQKVAVVGAPSVWHKAGLWAVPAGLIYEGLPKAKTPDLITFYAGNQMVWRRIAALMKDDPTLLPILRRTRADVRAHVSRLANDAGAVLDQTARTDDADAAYSDALALDGSNLSAALNRYGLRLRRGDANLASIDQVCRSLALSKEPSRFSENFDRAVARYGTLVVQPADLLVPCLLRDSPQGTTLAPAVIRLVGKWLSPRLDTAPGAPSALAGARLPPAAGCVRAHVGAAPASAELIVAIQAFEEGRRAEAEILAREVVKSHPGSLPGLTVLSEILLDKGGVKEVSGALLPAMRDAAKAAENALVLMIQGGVCLQLGAGRLEEARASLKRALELNPNLRAARDWLVMVGERLANDVTSEADARYVLGLDPSHAAAHALLGRLLVAQKRGEEAETHLRASLRRCPSEENHRVLSDLLRPSKRLAEAEQEARLAVRLAPCSFRSWETLGHALAAGGQVEGAAAAYACALAVNGDESVAYFPLIRLLLGQNKAVEASGLLRQAERRLPAASKQDHDVFADLAKLANEQM